MMINGIRTFVVFLILQNVYSATVLVQNVYIKESGSFLQYITDTGENLRSCRASFFENGEEILFSLDTTQSASVEKPGNFEDINNLSNRLTSLGQDLCGFRLVKWSSYDPTYWTLRAVDHLDDVMETSFTVIEFSIDENELNKNVKVTYGSSATIYCGESDISKYLCKLFNPSGELVSTACSYMLTVTMADIGEWRCLVGVIYNVELIEYVINVEFDDTTYTLGWANDEGDHYSIGCQVVNDKSTSSISHCLITDPLGQDYVIRNGRITERYNTLQTNLDKRICGIEIPKPLLDAEKGLWRCKIETRGKILYVENTTEPDYKKHITISTALSKPINIYCEVPYSATYCHIIAPDGTRHELGLVNRNMVDLGQCLYSINSVSEGDRGTWVCSFAKENATTVEDIEVEVQIIDALLFDEELVTNQNEPLNITCRTGGAPGVPVNYCLFVSPQNVSYFIYESLNTSDITYVGKGFNYGDCSIRINNVQSEHFGNWTCLTKIGLASDISVIILVTTESLSGATWLLIAIAVVLGIILIIIIIILFYYKMKKRRNSVNAETTVYSRSSNERNEAEVVISALDISETDVRHRR